MTTKIDGMSFGQIDAEPANAKVLEGDALNSTPGRPNVTKNEIVVKLRNRIASGLLRPGMRLPSHREIRREFNANIVTVGRAIDQLKAEGFVDTFGARGTFVSERPPHLFRYALIFPTHPSEWDWPRFWDALAKEAGKAGRDGEVELAVYFDIDLVGHAGSAGYAQLVEDLEAHRFAGLIFACPPILVRGTPLVEMPGIPRVAIMTAPNPEFPDLVRIELDRSAFIQQSIAYLASKGRRRLAVLTVPNDLPAMARSAQQEAAAHGMELRPYWIQSVHHAAPKSAQAIVQLLMSAPPGERPDALFITDDHLVECATAGLVDSGVKVSIDIDVVAHSNFPWPPHGAVPVKRIGFDAGQVLEACIASIDQLRRAGDVSPVAVIPPVFDDEVAE